VLGEPDDAQLVAEVVVAQLRVPVQNRRDSVGRAGPGQPDGSTSPMTRSTTTSSPIFTTARGRRGPRWRAAAAGREEDPCLVAI
jgi:hypothetical protein